VGDLQPQLAPLRIGLRVYGQRAKLFGKLSSPSGPHRPLTFYFVHLFPSSRYLPKEALLRHAMLFPSLASDMHLNETCCTVLFNFHEEHAENLRCKVEMDLCAYAWTLLAGCITNVSQKVASREVLLST